MSDISNMLSSIHCIEYSGGFDVNCKGRQDYSIDIFLFPTSTIYRLDTVEGFTHQIHIEQSEIGGRDLRRRR